MKMPRIWIILFPVYPDDSGKELATVLSYLAGRSLSREEIWTAMELPRSTYYDQLDKGTEITALAEEIRGGALMPHGSTATQLKTVQPAKIAQWRPRQDAPPL